MFSGFGGSSDGIEAAGIDVWFAANHNEFAVSVHELNHPGAEHFLADLVDPQAADYYHPEHLPAADILWASPSCTNHSKANAQRAYRQNLSLFDVDDEEYEAAVTHSERSRATAVCVLQYARKHRPKLIAVENVCEFGQWGPRVGNSRRGDGSSFRWWLKELQNLGYRTKILWLNSMFFGVPQSRDRMYVCAWDKRLRTPNLEFNLPAWCARCDTIVESRQAFKRPTKAWVGLPQWGKYGDQYVYRCPRCNSVVEPPITPAFYAIDWSDLGTPIGEREDPLAASTMARIERGVEKYFRSGRWPQVVMPAKAMTRGAEATTDRPLPTQTTQQELALLSLQVVAAGNTFERPGSTCRVRGVDQPLWTQHTTQAVGVVNHPALVDNVQGAARPSDQPLPTQAGSETMALVRPPFVMVNRTNNDPRSVAEPLAPFATGGSHMLINPPAFMVKNNGGADPTCRSYPLSESLGTIVGSANHQGLVVHPLVHTARGAHEDRPAPLAGVEEALSTVSAGGNHHFLLSTIFAKINGGPDDTAWHRASVESFNTLTTADGGSTGLLSPPDLDDILADIEVERCLYRMLGVAEIRNGMGFRPSFKMFGSKRDQVRGLGNAVTPPVATAIMARMTAVLEPA